MAIELIFTEAEQDIAEAFAWYEDQRPGLGEDFLRCVDACIQATRAGPATTPFAACRNFRDDDYRHPWVPPIPRRWPVRP